MSIREHFSERELEILRIRAERAANAAQNNVAEKELTALQITLGGEAYALPVERLRAVYEDVTVVPVPHTPLFVAGIANIRGRITPVLDLVSLLNVGRTTNPVSDALVVVSKDDLSLALRVENVGEVITFPETNIGPLPMGNELLEKARYLLGIMTDGPVLLSIDAILTDPALIVEDE